MISCLESTEMGKTHTYYDLLILVSFSVSSVVNFYNSEFCERREYAVA